MPDDVPYRSNTLQRGTWLVMSRGRTPTFDLTRNGAKGKMRKRYRIMLMAALVAALVVPVGFALSLDSDAKRDAAARTPMIAASTVAAPLSHDRPARWPPMPEVPDGAKLLLVGAGLFGLASAVRKAA